MNVKCELIEHVATLSTSRSGWTKEVNLIRWNDGAAVYDVRAWSPDHERSSKGVTLTEYEMNIFLATMLGRKNSEENQSD